MDYLVAEDTGDDGEDIHIYWHIVDRMFILKKCGFYMKQEVIDYLNQRCEKLRSRVPAHLHNFETEQILIAHCNQLLKKMKDIKITGDISLYQLFQVSRSEGYSALRNLKDWHVLAINDLRCRNDFYNVNFMTIIAKRNLVNILIRPWLGLELLAADLFMTDYCKLNLPYHVCLKVAQNMNDEDLFHLFDQTKICDVEQQHECDVCMTNVRFIRLAL
ncbi:hypothetical protein TKK_0000418 [Trichogramma kaykai]